MIYRLNETLFFYSEDVNFVVFIVLGIKAYDLVSEFFLGAYQEPYSMALFFTFSPTGPTAPEGPLGPSGPG